MDMICGPVVGPAPATVAYQLVLKLNNTGAPGRKSAGPAASLSVSVSVRSRDLPWLRSLPVLLQRGGRPYARAQAPNASREDYAMGGRPAGSDLSRDSTLLLLQLVAWMYAAGASCFSFFPRRARNATVCLFTFFFLRRMKTNLL
jgi:hypothetical protein